MVCTLGPQWPHAAGSCSPARGFSGTSIGSSGRIVTISNAQGSPSASAEASSTSPIGSRRWYAESAGCCAGAESSVIRPCNHIGPSPPGTPIA